MDITMMNMIRVLAIQIKLFTGIKRKIENAQSGTFFIYRSIDVQPAGKDQDTIDEKDQPVQVIRYVCIPSQ
jgi:hypothetical protein